MKGKILPIATTILWIITFGFALHNWTLGICIGLCMGVALGLFRSRDDDEESGE